ncbi:MAG: DEAD/DEAH box helicase [Methanosphaera sp.]|nr:DEAD/DEAH box helicase [Methanosphaera sp.]
MINKKIENIEDLLEFFHNKKWYRDRIEHIEEIPVRRAKYSSKDTNLPRPLANYLDSHDIKLYTHQYETLEHVRRGENVTITTPTASGKTLSFTLPVLEDLCNNKNDTALYIYPTKALANDQLKSMLDIDNECELGIYPGKYDGDTTKYEKKQIRDRSRLVITNPYELHLILPFHYQWERFYSNLKYIIIDEAHQYRGVFGSNMALLIRRLKRICKYYGSHPKFIISTATLANPEEFSQKLTGETSHIVTDNGSPSGKKYFVMFNPYAIESKNPSTHNDTLKLFNCCVENNFQTMCFEISRKMAEVVALRSQNELTKKDIIDKNQVTAYRAGYSVEERKNIEDDLKDGKIRGIVTTNALELGINIGSLDSVIISGYPGTLISTWQQAGRAGRQKQDSLVILVAFQNPLDQYFMKHPDDFFIKDENGVVNLNKTPENAIIDLNNAHILREHLKCAAFENELKINEIENFGFDDTGIVIDEINDLEMENILSYDSSNDQWRYSDERVLSRDKTPNLEVNLSDVRNDTYHVFNGRKLLKSEEQLEYMNEQQAFREAHENAVLIHNGDTYIVRELDIQNKKVYVKKQNVNYYTQALKKVDAEIVRQTKSCDIEDIHLSFGNLNVTEKYDKYNIVYNGKITSSKRLTLPPLKFNTKGFWFTIPYSIRQHLEESLVYDNKFKDVFMGSLQGVENVILSIIPSRIMCDSHDLGGVVKNMHEDTMNSTIFIYDAFEGGIGLTDKITAQLENKEHPEQENHDLFDEVIRIAYETVRDCDCSEGCPACIYGSQDQLDNKNLNKAGTLMILEDLHNIIKKDNDN